MCLFQESLSVRRQYAAAAAIVDVCADFFLYTFIFFAVHRAVGRLLIDAH